MVVSCLQASASDGGVAFMSLTGGRLSKSRRHERIISGLSAKPTLRASELAIRLGVSHETIRRDLMELDDKGLINRTYGGATRPFGFEPPVRERYKSMTAERERIAEVACGGIRENEVVLLGAGATTLQVARGLAARQSNITVITHDFRVADAVCSNPSIRTLFLPGRLHPTEGYVYGNQTINGIGNYQANWAIVGASGVGEHGVYDTDDEAAAVYRAMVLAAERSMIVADSSKFNQPSLMVYVPWEEVDFFVTERPPPDGLARKLREAAVKLEIAEMDEADA